jgi:ribosomal protein L2
VFSKSYVKKTNTVSLLKNSRWDKQISVITSLVRSKNKHLVIKKHLTGSYSVMPYLYGMVVGQYVQTSTLPKNFWLNNLPGNFVLLKYLSKFCIFSNIYLNNTRKYSTANGTYCQILDFFSDYNLCKVVLPSKKVKMFSGWSFVFLGRNSQPNKINTILGKAGIRVLTGKKPKNRGVARNPVDHPHGGRTKTNQPEVSIWGWVAKRNK